MGHPLASECAQEIDQIRCLDISAYVSCLRYLT